MARLKDRQTNEQLAMKQSFEGNCEILRTIFQLRALSFHIPADERGLLSNNYFQESYKMYQYYPDCNTIPLTEI